MRWVAMLLVLAGCSSAPPASVEQPVVAGAPGPTAPPGRPEAPSVSNEAIAALSIDPPDVGAARAHIERYQREQRWTDLARASERLLATTGATDADLERLLDAYRQLRDYDKATTLLLDLAGKTTDRTRGALLYRTLAEIAIEAGHDRKAGDYLRRSIQLDLRPESLVSAAHLLEQLQEYERARQFYELALHYDAWNVSARFALAGLDEQQHQLAAAAAHYDVLLRSKDYEVVAKAGERAITLAAHMRTLPDLEARLTRLATPPHRLVLVELYRETNNVRRLEQLAQFDRDGDVRRVAREALDAQSFSSAP